MQVGSLGDIVFEVSDAVVRTFKTFELSMDMKYAVHERLGDHYPLAEYVGAGMPEITLPITLNALLLNGVPVEDEIEKIQNMMTKPEAGQLFIGDRAYDLYYIESIKESVAHFGKQGEYLTADLTLTLKRYIDNAEAW